MASAVAFTAGGVLPLAAILLSPQQLRVPLTFAVVLLALAFTGVLGAKHGGSRPARATVRVVVGGALALKQLDSQSWLRVLGSELVILEAGQEIRGAVPDAHGQLDTPDVGILESGQHLGQGVFRTPTVCVRDADGGLVRVHPLVRYVTYRAAVGLPGTGSNGLSIREMALIAQRCLVPPKLLDAHPDVQNAGEQSGGLPGSWRAVPAAGVRACPPAAGPEGTQSERTYPRSTIIPPCRPTA